MIVNHCNWTIYLRSLSSRTSFCLV